MEAATCDPEVACLSLLGAALTVRRRDVFPFAGRAMLAEGRVEGCGLSCLLALVYGCADSRAALVEAVRADLRAGGMVDIAQEVE